MIEIIAHIATWSADALGREPITGAFYSLLSNQRYATAGIFPYAVESSHNARIFEPDLRGLRGVG
jgi:hypothetical protein